MENWRLKQLKFFQFYGVDYVILEKTYGTRVVSILCYGLCHYGENIWDIISKFSTTLQMCSPNA